MNGREASLILSIRLILDDDEAHLELVALPQIVSRKVYPSTTIILENV